MSGADGKALVQLAGMYPKTDCTEEALPVFKRALAEVGNCPGNQHDALREYFFALLRQIVNGRLEPGDGLMAVYDDIVRVGLYDARYPEFYAWYDRELRTWDFLDGDREMGEPASAELVGKIKIAARDCLRSNARDFTPRRDH